MLVERTAGALGASITDVDLTRPLAAEQVAELIAALDEHHVVFLPDQPLTLDDLERFTDELGGRGVTPYVTPVDGRPHVIRVIKEATDELNFANGWHTDLSYLPEPPLYTLLHAWDVPPAGGDTVWANQHLAFETLSPGLHDTLLGLRAVHSAGMSYGTGGTLDQARGKSSMAIAPSEKAFETHVHPAVIAHPNTGRPSLYVNLGYTTKFDGWSTADSRALLSYLYDHQVHVNFTCRLRWRKHTLTIWDNRAVQHNALNDYHGVRREMYRTVVAGSAPRPYAG